MVGSPAQGGLMGGLMRTLSACLAPNGAAGGEAKTILNAVLSSDDLDGVMNIESEAGQELSQLVEALQREKYEKQQLQANLEDKDRRLEVAQEQLVEYAEQRSSDVAAILGQAEALAGLAAEGGAGVAEAAGELRRMLADAATEASAFAAQQKRDLEKSGLGPKTGNGLRNAAHVRSASDVPDPKRQREAMEEFGEGNGMQASMSASDVEHMGSADFTDRAKYIPLRLDLRERLLLRLLEGALNVSEYTDKVDVITYNRTKRMNQQLRYICAILSGLLVAQNYKKGQKLVQDKNFQDNEDFFQEVFEIGRRHKILNPEKMRNDYGKLVYLLQDSQQTEVQALLEFNCVKPLSTVHTLLAEKGGERMLRDPLMETATAEIKADGKQRHQVQMEIRKKENARKSLVKKYRSLRLSEDDILLCLYSIGDNNSYLFFNRDPVEQMLAYLEEYFGGGAQVEKEYSLAITGGVGGARLTHNHQRQYQYAAQSLTLWREIMHDMFKLWYLAESDLLSENNYYRLSDTGQGLNRVQGAPGVSRAMHGILRNCQTKLGEGWVGSSVVHLGDHNVPNALMFIDKYTQVPRILNPVVLALKELPKIAKDPHIGRYIQDSFGGVEALKKTILCDFFRHAFDGSGADNFFDAGSCIDGRLTSAWNWCSKIEKKSYYPAFKLAGFSGFDGSFGAG